MKSAEVPSIKRGFRGMLFMNIAHNYATYTNLAQPIGGNLTRFELF